MAGQICKELSEKPWIPYDTSLVQNGPGIYVIGEKKGKQTQYQYVGRSNDVKRRLQEHTNQKQQDVDKWLAGKREQNRESEVVIKYVSEARQKSLEGKYMQCLTNKNGYRPVLNKREGDCCTSCATGQKCQSKSIAKGSTGPPKTPPTFPPHFRSTSFSKATAATSIEELSLSGFKGSSRGPSFVSSSGPKKVTSATSIRERFPGGLKGSSGRPSFRSSSAPKASSAASIRKLIPGGLKESSGRSSFGSSSAPKASSATSFRGLFPSGLKGSSGRPSFKSFSGPKKSSSASYGSSSGFKVSSAPSFRSSGGFKVSSGRSRRK